MNKFHRLLRYDWPLHFVLLLTNWLPDNTPFLALRGWLACRFIGSCGKNLRLGRNLTLYNPIDIHIGTDVYIAYGGWLAAGGKINIENEVMIGPYVVISAGNHTRVNASFRYGEPDIPDISIGKGVWIGGHSSILGGISIGEGSLVAGGSTVIKGSYPKDSFIAGVPAKIKKTTKDKTID
jgi:maltose O-acetyltransferase